MSYSNQQFGSTASNANMQPTQPQSGSGHLPPQHQPQQPVPNYTHANPMASTANMSGHPGVTLLGQNYGGYGTGHMASQVPVAGTGPSRQTSALQPGHALVNQTTSAPLHGPQIAPSVAAAAQQGLVHPPAGPATTSRIMTFREIDAIVGPNTPPRPPPTTRLPKPGELTRLPREYYLREKIPMPTSVDDSAMIYHMITSGFLADPYPHYLYDEEKPLLVSWYKHELIKKLNYLLDLDENQRTVIAITFRTINKNKGKQAAYPHQSLLEWIRTGLRKDIRFRDQSDWVGLLRQYTGELSIYDLMRLITEAYRYVQSGVTVGTVTYTAPRDVEALQVQLARAAQQAQAAQQARAAAPAPPLALPVAPPSMAVGSNAMSSGSLFSGMPSGPSQTATPAPAAMYQIAANHNPQIGSSSSAMPPAAMPPTALWSTAVPQVRPGRGKRNIRQDVQRNSRAASEAGTPILETGPGDRLEETPAAQPAFVLNKPRKRQADEEVEETVHPAKSVRHEQVPVPDGTVAFLPIQYENQGKRKAEEELVRDIQSPQKKMRSDVAAPSQSRTPVDAFQSYPDLDFGNIQDFDPHGDVEVNDLPVVNLDDDASGEDSRPFEGLFRDIESSHESAVPNNDDHEPRESIPPLSQVDLWLVTLRAIKWTKDDLWVDGQKYCALPPDTGTEDLRRWLEPAVAEGEEIAPLFRDLPAPHEDDFTELARCIRFAQSDSQLEIDWRDDPFHCEKIYDRTNKYGRELLRGRNTVGSKNFEGVDWYNEDRAHAVMNFAKFVGEKIDLTAANMEVVYAMMEEQNVVVADSMAAYLIVDNEMLASIHDSSVYQPS